MTASQKPGKIKRIYHTRRRRPDGLLVSTHAAANLVGAIIDLQRTGKLDTTIRRTLHRVENSFAKSEKFSTLDAQIEGRRDGGFITPSRFAPPRRGGAGRSAVAAEKGTKA
jgi:hypothetical protein